MSAAKSRDTFISCAELFQSSAQQCLRAEQALRDTLSQVDEPYSHGLELIARAEYELAAILQRHARSDVNLPVQTRLQFSQEQHAPEAGTAGEALKELARVNDELLESLQDLQDKSSPASVREMIDSLLQDMRTINRRISAVRISMRDA